MLHSSRLDGVHVSCHGDGPAGDRTGQVPPVSVDNRQSEHGRIF